jgi:hypothetical protein
MKNSLNILLLSICMLAGKLTAGNNCKSVPDSSFCLELQGKVLNIEEGSDQSCTVTIRKLNGATDTLVLRNGQKKFRRYFQKNTSYTVTVSKVGFISKVIIIDTKLDDFDEKLYRFYFDATMEPDSGDAAFIRQENSPVALIFFDKKKGCFYYSKYAKTLALHR